MKKRADEWFEQKNCRCRRQLLGQKHHLKLL